MKTMKCLEGSWEHTKVVEVRQFTNVSDYVINRLDLFTLNVEEYEKAGYLIDFVDTVFNLLGLSIFSLIGAFYFIL